MTLVKRDDRQVVTLAGRLAGTDAAELERLGRSLCGAVDLDLCDLSGADETGVAVLRRLRSDGFNLLRMSPYLELLIG